MYHIKLQFQALQDARRLCLCSCEACCGLAHNGKPDQGWSLHPAHTHRVHLDAINIRFYTKAAFAVDTVDTERERERGTELHCTIGRQYPYVG